MDRYDYQQKLNSITEARVRGMIKNGAPKVEAALARMNTEAKIANDFTASIGIQTRRNDAKKDVIFLENGNKLYLNMDKRRYGLHSNAVGQLADKLSVPAKYLRELAEGATWQKKLAAEILNEHSGWTDRNRVLIRTVGGEVRGVLSDSYRRLNSMQIVMAFLDAATSQGGVPCDALMTDTKIFIETIHPTPLCFPTKMNGDVAIYMGARFSTSDYGDGSVDLKVFLLNGVCLNGMVRETAFKQIHLGSKLPQDFMLSQQTYKLDTLTTLSAITDFTANLYSPQTMRQKALEIQDASSREVDFDAELKNLLKGNRLLKSETEGVQKLLMNNMADDGLYGDPSLWKFTQAITAYARELAPVRARELQELSGELLGRVKMKTVKEE